MLVFAGHGVLAAVAIHLLALPFGSVFVDLLFLLIVVLVGPQVADLSTYRRAEKHAQNTRRREVEQSGLGRIEVVHDCNGGHETKDVGDQTAVEVGLAKRERRAVWRLPEMSAVVVTQSQRDEEARHYDVAQPQHREGWFRVGGSGCLLWPHHLDGSFEGRGHGNHDSRTKDKIDVVEKEASEEDAAGLE